MKYKGYRKAPVRTVRFWVIALFALLIFSACAEVPLTGRSSFQVLPHSQMLALSQEQYGKVLNESRLSKDTQEVVGVRRVGSRIAAAAEELMRDYGRADEIKNYGWEFNLIEEDKTVNAWAMPGGKIAVYTGILPITRDDTGLAVVMGHEVAHVLAGHGNERMSQALAVQLGGMTLAAALNEKPTKTRQLYMAAFGLGANVGILLPYSRLHESEADRIGLTIMAKAGYDPRQAAPFWERMNEKGGARPPEFLSTHPAPDTRIKDLKSYVPEALTHYRNYKK